MKRFIDEVVIPFWVEAWEKERSFLLVTGFVAWNAFIATWVC